MKRINRVFIPTNSADDWKGLLANPTNNGKQATQQKRWHIAGKRPKVFLKASKRFSLRRPTRFSRE